MIAPARGRAANSVGIIGTGQLGKVFVDRYLESGYEVAAFDISRTALKGLDPRVRRCESPAEVAALASTVVTCVPDPAAVEACVLGADGVIKSAHTQTLIIDTTSSLPSTTRMVGQRIAEVGAVIVDAPVSRGVPAAVEGNLSIWVGGSRMDVGRALPFLEPLGSDILHVGELGSGHAVKAVNMMMMAVNLVAAAEVMAIADAYGIDEAVMLDVLNASSGGSFVTASHFPKYVRTGSYDSKFKMSLMHKDLRLARGVADGVGIPTLFGDRVTSIYSLCIADAGHLGESDNMLVVSFIRDLLSESARKETVVA